MGRLKPLLVAGAAALVIAIATSATPLGDVVQRRLDNGKSNGVRMYLTERALEGMRESPVLGFGSTRNTMGGRQSIAIGESEACERCGNFTIGGNGQLWQLLFAHGLVGTLAYFGFFVFALWRFRRDTSPIGLAASTAIFGSFVASLWYNSLVTPLAFTFLGYVLLWRNNMPPAPVEPKVTSATRERQCPPDESEDGTAATDGCRRRVARAVSA
jgi:O-antigen ligase